ncbi:MAG: hypothetical protein KAW56_09085 [Candidatus Marinimicrobia bacterium]|nr:hypothetical protein [candidate division WOR-3 bacterium]MCK4447224.1 hypothetical protein [Candidatus Neomarinimicrobiota bacterium]
MKLYKVGKAMKKPMTRVIDDILREYLDGIEIVEQEPAKEISLPGIYKIVKKK